MSGLPPGPRGALAQTISYALAPDDFVVRMARRYGDPFTVPTPAGAVVVTGDPDGLCDLLGADAAAMEGFGAEYIGRFVGERSLMLTGGEAHARDRRLLNPLFAGARLAALRERMRSIASRHAETIPVGQPFAVEPLATAYSLDVILEAVLGVADRDRAARLGQAIHEKIVSVSPALLFVPELRRAPFGLGPWARYVRAERALDDLLEREIRARRADGAAGDDVLSQMLAARDDEGRALDDAHVRDHLLTLLIAGHETTAIALTWAVYWLHRTPDALAAVERELASGEDDRLLDAVCKETLRLHPVAPEFMRRLLAPITVKGHRLPAGTGVAVSLTLLHTRPDLYPDPLAFRPSRFLSRRYSRFEYAPFGGGPNVCIGAQLALAEMKIALATWLRTWRLVPCSRAVVRSSRRGRNWVVGPDREIRMVARRRGLRRAP